MLFNLLAKRLVPFNYGDVKIIEDIPVKQLEWESMKFSHISIAHTYTDLFGHQSIQNADGAGIGETNNKARVLAVMELIERYSVLSDTTIRSILNNYIPAVNNIKLQYLFPYQKEQLIEIENNPHGIFDLMVNAKGMISNSIYNLPAASVFPRWKSFLQLNIDFPETEGSGIAAGFIWEKEQLWYRALCEIIEREHVMLAWRLKSWSIDQLNTKHLISEEQANWIDKNDLILSIFDVGSKDMIPVIIALIHDEKGNNLSLGSSCGKGGLGDINKAIEEAIMLRSSAKALDREYPLFNDDKIDSSEMHLLYGWRNGEDVLKWFLEGAQKVKKIAKSFTEKQDLNLLAKICKEKYDFEPMIIDVTHPELRLTSYRVYRVILPNTLKKEYRHTQPYLGGKILSEIKEEDSKTINPLPHPVA